MTDPTPINTNQPIVTVALDNVLTDIWNEQNKHKDIGDHPEEFRRFCESVLYSALSKEMCSHSALAITRSVEDSQEADANNEWFRRTDGE